VSAPTYAVLVAGGGPVGWACALAARQSLGSRARIAVVERAPPPAVAPGSPLSPRVYTISSGNTDWLRAQGVRFAESRMAAVNAIVVNGRDGGESLRVNERDSARDLLAWVMEHEALTEAIAARAQALGIELVPGSCVATQIDGASRLLELADRSLHSARLVVIADGAASALRELAGVEWRRRDYPQHGVVAHLECAAPHRGAARQWFMADGTILALLPLPDIDGAPAVSMVWSADVERAQLLTAMPVTQLLDEINRATAGEAGVTAVRSPARAFPLTLVRAPDPVVERAVVVGDAAHAVHPLAGQGVNLGLGDARALAETLAAAATFAGDAGHALLLGRYRRSRYAATLAMQATTDGLFRLYNQTQHPLLMAAGDAGMRLFGRLPAFRRILSSAATR